MFRCSSMACPQMLKHQLLQAGRAVYNLSVDRLYYTYVLRSTKDGHLYIGWTDDLKNRVRAHNIGEVAATRYRIPLVLVYYEACLSKQKAILREKTLKTGFGRKYLKRRI